MNSSSVSNAITLVSNNSILQHHFGNVITNWNDIENNFDLSNGNPDLMKTMYKSINDEYECNEMFQRVVTSLKKLYQSGSYQRTEYATWYIKRHPSNYLNEFNANLFSQYLWLTVYVIPIIGLPDKNPNSYKAKYGGIKYPSQTPTYRKCRSLADSIERCVRHLYFIYQL
jgi:hypothetical protein